MNEILHRCLQFNIAFVCIFWSVSAKLAVLLLRAFLLVLVFSLFIILGKFLIVINYKSDLLKLLFVKVWSYFHAYCNNSP